MCRTRVLAILPGVIPSAVIGLVKPLTELHHRRRIDFRISLEPLVSRGEIAWADVVAFCRNFEPAFQQTLDFLASRRTPFIYELDDNLFELPLDTPDGQYVRTPARLGMLERYLSSAALVRVYSDPIKQLALRLNPRVEQVVPPVDLKLISPPRPRPRGEKIRIVYATSRRNDRMAELFLPALRRIAREYRGRVEPHFWGNDPDIAREVQGAVFRPYMRDYDRYLRRFSACGFEIGLAPLFDDSFHRSKTNNKFREYGASRIAGIYSDVDVYSACVRHQETGVLVGNTEESWYAAMATLIEDAKLREHIRERAHAWVAEHYAQEPFEEVWHQQIQTVLDQKPASRADSRMAAVSPARTTADRHLVIADAREQRLCGGQQSCSMADRARRAAVRLVRRAIHQIRIWPTLIRLRIGTWRWLR